MKIEEQTSLSETLTNYIRKSFNMTNKDITGTIGLNGIGLDRPMILIYIEPSKAPMDDELKLAVNNIIKGRHKTTIDKTTLTDFDKSTNRYIRHQYVLVSVYLTYAWKD